MDRDYQTIQTVMLVKQPCGSDSLFPWFPVHRPMTGMVVEASSAPQAEM